MIDWLAEARKARQTMSYPADETDVTRLSSVSSAPLDMVSAEIRCRDELHSELIELDENLQRVELSAAQRGMVAANLANMPAHRPGSKSANLQTSQADAAQMLKVSPRTVAAASKVKDEGSPELVGAVDRGCESVSGERVGQLHDWKLPETQLGVAAKTDITTLSSVLAAGAVMVSDDFHGDDRPVAVRFRVIEGGRHRDVTMCPPPSAEEMRERFGDAVVAACPGDLLDRRLLPVVTALAAVIGERDPDLVQPLACAEGLAWIQDCACRALRADLESSVGSLTPGEAIAVAEALAPLVPDPASRELATVMAAVRGPFAPEELRAAQARRALALIATWAEES